MSTVPPSPNVKVASAVLTLAAVGGLLGYWDKLHPILEWMILKGALFIVQPQAQALGIGTLVGVAVSWWVPHFLPGLMPAKESKRWLGLVCSLVTFCVAWGLEPTVIGFWMAVIAGMIGWPLVVGASKLFYTMLPKHRPESLEP